MESVEKMLQKLDELEKEALESQIKNAILRMKSRRSIELRMVIDKYHLFISPINKHEIVKNRNNDPRLPI